MIDKIKDIRKAKTTNVEGYTKLHIQLWKETDKAKEVEMEEMSDEIMDHKKNRKYDLMYRIRMHKKY